MMKTFKHTIKNIGLLLFLGFLTPVLAQKTPAKPDKDLKELINKGLSAYDKADYEAAELSFRKALAKDPMNAVASYNLGLTETELDKNLEAAHFFEKAAKTADDASLKSKAYFNQGNVWYQKKKYEKAIEAYKNALRNNPEDEEARYNLALAQMKLKKKQNKNKNKNKNKNNKNKKDNKKNKQNKNQQNKQNQNKDQKNKDQKNKNNKGQDKKDQQKNKGDQKKKDQNKKDQKNKDNKGKGDQKKDDKGKPKDDKQNKQEKQKDQQKQQNGKNGQKQQQPQQGEGQKRKVKLTPQQVKQLLVALKNKEQKTQKKVKAKILRGRGKKQKQDKDW